MAKRARKQKPEDLAEKEKIAALAQQKLEKERAWFLKRQDDLLEKLGGIVGIPGAKVYEIVQWAMPSAEKEPVRRLLYLAQLVLQFARLKRAKVVRRTPLITILQFQVGGGKSRGGGGRLNKPMDDLDRMDRRRTEPIYVYRPSRARKRLVH